MSPTREPLETAELLAFARVVDARSLSRAAAELGVPRATISRRLARLEARLGARLLRRTTRTLALTDAGEALYRHARLVLDAVAQAEASVRRTDHAVRGDLRVSVPAVPLPSFRRAIAAFAERHPALRLHVHVSNGFVDLRREGYDVAIRATATLEPGLVARTILRESLLAVASRDYLAKHGTPRSTTDLRRHRCLMGFARGELPATHWRFGPQKLPVDGVFFSNDMHMLLDAALRGLGIAALPFMFAHDHLASGALVPVLPGVLEHQGQMAVVYLEREFVPPQVRAFVDAIAAWAAETFPEGALPPKRRRSSTAAPRT